MSNNISGYGLRVTIVASVTFPAGLVLSQFSDDADPIDTPAIVNAETAMGLNGDMVFWSAANPTVSTIAVIAGSADDLNLSVLADSNRVGKDKSSNYDEITMTVVYPDGSTATGTKGVLTNSQPIQSIASAGRKKTNVYTFSFENVNRQNAAA